jgi:Ala-tRNA(Pro) deacylase
MQNVFEFLDELGVLCKKYEHPAVFTVEEAQTHRPNTDFWENKNLFLRNKKGDKHYLVTLDKGKRLDLLQLGKELGEKVGLASPERLLKYLNVTPGSVSPFGLLNDAEHAVLYILDKDALEQEYIGVHPNINTQTIVMKTSDFLRAIEAIGNIVLVTKM